MQSDIWSQLECLNWANENDARSCNTIPVVCESLTTVEQGVQDIEQHKAKRIGLFYNVITKSEAVICTVSVLRNLLKIIIKKKNK